MRRIEGRKSGGEVGRKGGREGGEMGRDGKEKGRENGRVFFLSPVRLYLL